MKTISTLVLMLTLLNGFSQITVNANTSHSAVCTNCVFNIASGVTLTINSAGTCANCTFNGGNIVLSSDMTCQPCSFNGNNINIGTQSLNPNSGTTSFTNVTLTASGTGSVLANTPVTVTGSTFTFNGTSDFNNNGGQLDMSNSTMYFYGDAYFIANAGPVNLKSSSYLIAGNGSSSSHAYIKLNGPTLNEYDNSSAVVLGASNNYYYNWSSYNSISNSKTYSTTYPSAASTMNCGGAGQNACGMWSTPSVYGPATFNYAGVVGVSILPVLLTNFTATFAAGSANLSWTTEQESNSSYFGIERSTNGSNWQEIATVDAKGNSQIASNYTYADQSAVNGVSYYRLKMVDKDGSYMYSEIRVIHSSLVKTISFFPNPTRDYVNVTLGETTGTVKVQLIGQAGQVLQERNTTTAAGSTVSMNVQNYAQGMYIVKVTSTDGTEQSAKLIVAR